ncbi:lytic polysaccharide monooxygenase [Patellaria atrata CBS 101060]|uniref:AA9 family lytic polysaccharide monooxygenase n=1 Tax=Patellaria atrata CBS 101060 TaxID=1346257 RepID=A0A9P4VMT8_9PEZI|nr:lytic polysaccharide monooxygenase [Patellaria atrata CBS 101060]
MKLFASSSIALAALLQSSQVAAHTFIWGVFLNGVDQGSFRGIRTPAFNGAPPSGYNNSPVKNLTSIDMRCNVLGDFQNSHTIKVVPGDTLTFDWHHDYRTPADDVIDTSHHGPAMIYLSPDPPTENSFVKIWEKGLWDAGEMLKPGKWATTADIKANGGLMHMRVPEGLKAGFYLVRAELVGLHESDARFDQNPIRGAQFYPNCVQIEVTGDGTVELPEGVGFPGAYKYSDPGVHYDIYCSTKTKITAPCTLTYEIPGPTVWSGAYPDTTAVEVGPVSGATAKQPWSSWIIKSVVTSATYSGTKAFATATSVYTASWSSVYQTPTPAPMS